LTALLLDVGVLAHSRLDLADLRIADAGNHQIPYLLERRQETLELNLSLLPEKAAASETKSRYRLELPFENLPDAKLVLTTTENVPTKNYRRNKSGSDASSFGSIDGNGCECNLRSQRSGDSGATADTRPAVVARRDIGDSDCR
jgi:hypothetical protein